MCIRDRSINAFFNNINWADFGMTLSDAAQGILDTLLTAIRGVDWGQIGTDIATFIKNIDWWGVAGSLLQTIIAAVHGIGSGILSLAADPVSYTHLFSFDATKTKVVDAVLRIF